MSVVKQRLAAVDRVRHGRRSMAADIVATALDDPSAAVSEHPSARVLRQFAERIVDIILHSLDDAALGVDTDPVPGMESFDPELVREICRLATNGTWDALIEAASPADRALLLRLAERVFAASHDFLQAVVSVPAVGPLEDGRLWTATAEALVRGEAAEDIAGRANVRLASSYVVAVVDRRASSADQLLRPGRAPDRRRDVLAAVDGDDLVVLVPALKGLHSVEIRSHAGQVLRSLGIGAADSVVGSAAAKDRASIVAAVAEARSVMQVVQVLRYPSGVYQVEDVPVEVSLMRSPDVAGLLALRLVPLYSSGAPLLETLRVYLETSQDRRQAAAALHIHSNSLDYRLRRIRELTGLSPTVPRDIQTLGAALMAWRLQRMPDEALSGDRTGRR